MAYNEYSDNEENGNPTKYVHSWKSIWIYVQCYFVTIASILGTGILGLPDTTWQSGFTPFLTTFLIDYVMRVLSILFFVDLMQKAQVYMLLRNEENNPELVPLNEINYEDDLNDFQDDTSDGTLESREDVLRNIWSRNEDNYNNLHQLSLLYMPYYLWIPFDVTVFVTLLAIILSYSLAGPQAFAELLGIQNYVIVIPFFVWILALSIAIFGEIIKVTISFLTLFKCGILTAVVIVTIGVGAKVDNPIHNDFSHSGSSFLLGTVALGGVINILPILYINIEPIKQQVRCFFLASFAGLTTCAIFIILWVLSVLHIVPQTEAQCRDNFSQMYSENGTASHLLTNIIPPEDCYKYTLKRSEENGQISTVPLTEIILHFFPEYKWVGRFIQIFIAVSITVSYLAFGSGLKSILGGVLDAVLPESPNSNESTSTLQRVTTSIVFRPVVLLLIFLIIFVIAMLNPKGFIVVLEFAGSIGINLEVVFVVAMIQGSRKYKYRHVKAPWKLPELTYYLQYGMGAFFLFAVAYAIIKAIVSIA